MTITDGSPTWKDLITELSPEDVRAYVTHAKAWLMRSGGAMQVKRAEKVGAMVVLSGVDVLSGHPCAASVPMTRAA